MAAQEALNQLCEPAVAADAKVLILGELSDELFKTWTHAHTTAPVELTHRYDLAVLVDPAALSQDKPTAQLLAIARDQWARQVILLIPLQADTDPTPEDLIALGFKRRKLPESMQQRYTAYSFSITTYKTTPDWLNAKFWANPERWGKR